MKPDAAAGRSPVNELTRWVVLAGIAIMVWLAPTVSAAVWSTTGWRPGSRAASLFAAYAHLFAPQRVAGSGLAGGRFGWTVVGLFAAAIVVWSVPARSLGRRRRAVLRGLATRRDLRRFAPAEIVARSVTILGVRTKDPRRAGLLAGRDVYTGGEVWLSKESTLLVLAPPRSGKTSGTVAPAVIDHHGPVVATGVRHDIMQWTHPWRADRAGPLWLCEPMLEPGTRLPDGVHEVRWSPLSGCTDLVTAQLRAEALFAAIPKGGANDEYWRNAGTQLLAGLLMAAAVQDGRITDVVGWINRDSDTTPADLLRAAARLLDEFTADIFVGIAGELEAAAAQDPRYKAGVTGQARQAMAPFRLPAIRRMCDVSIADSFDPVEFLTASGTIWMLGSEEHQSQAAGVCTALTASIVEQARRLARAGSGRLQPPLLLALDEAVNVAPIPRLEQLLSTGGGSGIQTIVVLQSLAAARHAWGQEMGDALLDFNNAKLVLGGLGDAQDLQDISTLLGQRDERVVQTSRSGSLRFFDISDTTWSWRQVPVMRPDEIREIDSEKRGHALLVARSTPGILLRQDRIFNRTPPRRKASA